MMTFCGSQSAAREERDLIEQYVKRICISFDFSTRSAEPKKEVAQRLITRII